MTENEILNQALKKFLNRETTDEDAKLTTRYFYTGSGLNYDFYYKKIKLGRMHKYILFSKTKLKFK